MCSTSRRILHPLYRIFHQGIAVFSMHPWVPLDLPYQSRRRWIACQNLPHQVHYLKSNPCDFCAHPVSGPVLWLARKFNPKHRWHLFKEGKIEIVSILEWIGSLTSGCRIIYFRLSNKIIFTSQQASDCLVDTFMDGGCRVLESGPRLFSRRLSYQNSKSSSRITGTSKSVAARAILKSCSSVSSLSDLSVITFQR